MKRFSFPFLFFGAPSRQAAGPRKVARVLLLAGLFFLAFELALQVRDQVRNGQSVFTLLFEGNSYVDDPQTGLRLLKPNSVFRGQKVTLRANSLGLRSPEIAPERMPGSWRIAVIGASTVMGLYASDTETTFPARLEQRLRHEYPQRRVEVVNAGIMGYDLKDQQRMLETRVAALKPDLVVLYSGFNDFWYYCHPEMPPPNVFQPQGLPVVTVPEWLATVGKIRDKTMALRTMAGAQPNTLDARAVDLAGYRFRLESLVRRAGELKLPLLLATNARSFRREQPLEEQLALSSSARAIHDCFSLDGLHVLNDRHNELIRSVAEAHGLPLLPIDALIPGGERYFVDAQHFTEEGEQLVGDALAGFIVSRRLLPE